MRYANEGSFRRQFSFLRQQFLQDGELPCTDPHGSNSYARAVQNDVQSSDHVIMDFLPRHFDLVPSLPKLILRLF